MLTPIKKLQELQLLHLSSLAMAMAIEMTIRRRQRLKVRLVLPAIKSTQTPRFSLLMVHHGSEIIEPFKDLSRGPFLCEIDVSELRLETKFGLDPIAAFDRGNSLSASCGCFIQWHSKLQPKRQMRSCSRED